MHNIKPTKMNYINSKHWMVQKMVTVLTDWSEEDEWGEDEEYQGQRLDCDSHCSLMVGEGG